MAEERERQWQNLFWSGDYEKIWTGAGKIKPPTEEELNGILELLRCYPSPRSTILDWAGGYGRVAIPLAQRGYNMVLLDYAPNHIAEAEAQATKAGVKLRLICADFRETPSDIQAYYAINMFTSGIGYLSEQDDLAALQSLCKALKRGARFLLDTMNLLWLAANFQEKSGRMSEQGDFVEVEERWFDFATNRLHSHHLYRDRNGKDVEHELDHRIYSAPELIKLLGIAGFECKGVYGDFDSRPLGLDTKRLIIVSQRV